MNINEPSNQALVIRKEQTRNEREMSASPNGGDVPRSYDLSERPS